MTENEAIEALKLEGGLVHRITREKEKFKVTRWQSRHWKRCSSTARLARWRNAVQQWRIRQQRNRITRETDTQMDSLYMIHGFVLAAVSITRSITTVMIIVQVVVKKLDWSGDNGN